MKWCTVLFYHPMLVTINYFIIYQLQHTREWNVRGGTYLLLNEHIFQWNCIIWPIRYKVILIDIAGVLIIAHGAQRRKHHKASWLFGWQCAKFSFQSECRLVETANIIRIIYTPCIVITKVSFFFIFQVKGTFKGPGFSSHYVIFLSYYFFGLNKLPILVLLSSFRIIWITLTGDWGTRQITPVNIFNNVNKGKSDLQRLPIIEIYIRFWTMSTVIRIGLNVTGFFSLKW